LQLLLLTVRPIFFVAIKKSFAERYVCRRWTIENHSQLAHIRACSDAARRNLRLARRLLAISNRRLLQAPLHHIFNAAIILMLQELVCTNLGPHDIEDVLFTIEIFEAESRTGSNYALDCHRVLQDLRSLVTRLKVPPAPAGATSPDGQPQPPVGGDANGTAIIAVHGIGGANGMPVAQANAAKLHPETGTHGVNGVGVPSPAPVVVPVAAPLPTENVVLATTAGAAPAAIPVTVPVVTMQMDPRYAAGAAAVAGAATCGQAAIAFPQLTSAMYQQFVTWMEFDDLQMYNDYLI
jgi:hypothetical protein